MLMDAKWIFFPTTACKTFACPRNNNQVLVSTLSLASAPLINEASSVNLGTYGAFLNLIAPSLFGRQEKNLLDYA